MDEEDKDVELDSEGLDDSVVEEEFSREKIKSLKERLKEVEAKAKEYLDGWQRTQAEFVNTKRRDEEAKADFFKFASADLVYQLLAVLDSFELSLPHGNKELEVVYKQFLSILKSNGLEEINPMGEGFDPKKHESIGTIDVEDSGQDHKILEVIQKGYILSGKIIRPAKVKIGQYHE